MKTKFLRLSAVAIVVVTLLSLGLFFSCEEKDGNNEKTNNPLKNTEWKLIEFVDVANNTTKIPEPSDSICYRLEFVNDTLLRGYSSTNDLNGHYIIYSNDSIKLNIGQMTFINEVFEGDLFVESLNLISSYIISDNNLKLYYNNNQNYLKFERR